MSIIPASRLSTADLDLLGNNLRPTNFKPRRRNRLFIAAVNRSLEGFGEKVKTLHRRPLVCR